MHPIQALASRRRDDDEGFTLIELMVVVLIIAILIAIAIPTFLGARQRAQDRAAQSDLRNGLTAEKTFYTDRQYYDDYTADLDGNGVLDLTDIESSLNWADNKATGVNVLDVEVTTDTVTDDSVCLHITSKSGAEFRLVDIAAGPNAGTYYEKDVCPGAGGAGWTSNGGW